MDLIRTLGVAIDPTAAKAGGAAVSDTMRKVGTDAQEMEKKVDGAGKSVDKTGETMSKTSRAGEQLRATLTRQNETLDLLTLAINQLTSRLNLERSAVTATTDAHNKAAAVMSRTTQEAKNLATAVDVEARKLKESGSAAKDAANAKSRAADQARDAAGKFTGSGSSMLGMFKSLKAAILASGLTLFAADLLRTEMQVQRTSNALRFASTGMADFNRNRAFVFGVSEDLGMNNLSSSREFAKFMAAGKDTQFSGDQLRAIYLSVAKASTVLGLSADETAGTLNALQQMISKGTVQAEELRGQLGERLPGAFGMAARSMGVTTQELGKMLERGDVTAYRLLPALARELEKAFGPEASRAATSLNSEFNRMGNAWTNFKSTLMSSGVGEFFKDILGTTTKILNNASEIVSDTAPKLPQRRPVTQAQRDAIAAAEAEQAIIDAANQPLNRAQAATMAKHRRQAATQQPATAAANGVDPLKIASEEWAAAAQNREALNKQVEEGNALYKIYEAERQSQIKSREAQTRAAIDLEWELAVQNKKALEKQIADGNELYMKQQAQRRKFMAESRVRTGVGFRSGIDDYFRQQNGTAGIREAGKEAGVSQEEIDKIEAATIRMERFRAIGTGTAQAINDGFGSFTDEMIRGTENIGRAFTNMTAGILRDIAMITARQMIATPLAGALSSFIGSAAGGLFNFGGRAAGASTGGSFSSTLGPAPSASIGQFHIGGIVGQSPGVTRVMPSVIFHNAPRFHSGLRHDEFPAILQKGEEVIPKNMVGRGGASVVMPITVNVNASDSSGSSDGDRKFGEEVARQIESMVDMRIQKALSPQSLMRRSAR